MFDARYFKWKGRWSVKFLPEKPNGFAVYLLSGQDRTVEDSSSIWETHPEKKIVLEHLLNNGYTVFTSDLHPHHWGNEAACAHSEQLIHFLLKSEIINKRIHVFAEGWGAVLAIKLLARKHVNIRSMLFFNPCIYLESYYDLEKQNRLYYKKIKNELSTAYGTKPERINRQWVRQISQPPLKEMWPPLFLIHRVNERHYPLPAHSRKLEQELLQKGQSVQLKLFSSTRPFHSLSEPTVMFYQKHEQIL
ncbi:alpha/beta fold hydrolase [Alkalicoccobacillus murimartini]|uniref:Pimeloyl-ACP methyl ester carboxylesterase n=1 Tax=Alkalicoccobacillus murimartini TaxID=171685 RepID=A0ABT9YLM3_9BACI|nr:hypothetical protein [Alkalicoccobacillus murimartini]MDQ0207929.1 pimeloyl-ACP methyl ester carboxylesterase [Alkalicoccobacillus murimartini]